MRAEDFMVDENGPPAFAPTTKFDRMAQSGICKDGTCETPPFEMLETN
jgi:hypothetical protein